ncbi:MAG: TlpA family protein disulfide reductase [Bacteroidales bacterium]|nr:TlpA family protein disulfide reductase [Bacteroidales bacterium]
MFLKDCFYILSLSVLVLIGCTGNKTDKKEKLNEELNIEVNTESNTSGSLDDGRGYIVKVGDIAPDFEMTLSNGETVQLSSLRGKVVMLQFTASWCGVCRKEMPYIEKDIWIKYKNNPAFALYGIDREEPVEKVNELIEKTGVTYPIGLDPDAGIFTLYAKEKAGITRNVIIDRDGRIVMLTRLFEMEEFREMVEMIDGLLENPF